MISQSLLCSSPQCGDLGIRRTCVTKDRQFEQHFWWWVAPGKGLGEGYLSSLPLTGIFADIEVIP